ncbi:F-box domain-containing protein [Aspergillus aculeatinus CBS 121060]|uniref:F-box domain-containing protein n=1 Tax=Aspergillus aculeatinus CBS 121060 TaxID=1448322 RepID=A0ACD1H138_9EURO|nr:F-box domain-containing protein [Aspergillus aculeatinus CBS 121060]RAH67288.1 F-box domain-containing protein [Aspergillus aculeatinus CBS 121060]
MTSTNLACLPLEIIHRVLYFMDLSSLCELALTNRRLSAISQRELLKVVTVYPRKESRERFQDILEDRTRARLVHRLYLDVSAWAGYFTQARYVNQSNRDKEILQLRRFMKLVPRLKELPCLRSIVLRFHPGCYVEDTWDDSFQSAEFRSCVMTEFISAVTSLDEPVKELSLCNFQNINPTDLTVVLNLTQILGSLRALRLNIANEHDEGNGENDLEQDEPHKFFPELPSFWLTPAAATLEHLTIYSSNYFGFYPKLDLRGVHLPRLKTLALGKYAFVHDSQLQWILSHGKTLTELYLENTPILFEVSVYNKDRALLDSGRYTHKPGLREKHFATYDKRWHHYFRAFQAGLPHLRHFRYGRSELWWEDNMTPLERETGITVGMHDDSYMVFCDGFGPTPYMHTTIYDSDDEEPSYEGDGVDCVEEDQQALVGLLGKIGQPLEVED